MDREAMWDAKVGPSKAPAQGEARPGGAEAAPGAEPKGAQGAALQGSEELLAHFEELMPQYAQPPVPAGDGGPRAGTEEDAASHAALGPRHTRVGETHVDASSLPALAIPRRSELRDLLKGSLDVDRRIDLHGRTVDEALHFLRDELAHARGVGLRYLLVITGKGRRSVAGARLRPAVQDYLAREGSEHVLWFEEAPPRLGGRGAFLIRLRRAGRPRVEAKGSLTSFGPGEKQG